MFVAIVNLIAGLLVFLKDKDNLTNKFFALFTSTFAFWCLFKVYRGVTSSVIVSNIVLFLG